MQSFLHTLGVRNIFKTDIRSDAASSVGEEIEPSEEATEMFLIAPSVHSKNTNARISRSKPKERVKNSCFESRTAAA